jgi:malonyl-CoA O-methyltransferase
LIEPAPPKQTVRSAFDRAAASYDEAAHVQREICDRLADFAVALPAPAPAQRILDVGCGTGYALGLLAQRYPEAAVIALDFAPAMLARLPAVDAEANRPLPLCADLEALPLAGAAVDAIWSSLALQWCEPSRALPECARALRPGGVAWIATLGPRTLWELREAFAAIDEAEHVIRFHSRERWLQESVDAGFDVIAEANSTAFALAADLRGLLRDIKAIGAHSVGPQRRRQPLGRAAWRVLESRYEVHRRDDGLLPATYDVILLALRKP